MGKLIDLTGRIFGRLKVLSRVNPHASSTWLVRCTCGVEKVVLGTSLKDGSTKSCGCLRRERARRKRLSDTMAGRNQVLWTYKISAENRKLEWSLSDSDFDTLIQGDCIYCGSHPSNVKKGPHFSPFTYSGIDRFNNTIGYTKSNSVSCCQLCNAMKRKLSSQEFIAHILKAATHQQAAI